MHSVMIAESKHDFKDFENRKIIEVLGVEVKDRKKLLCGITDIL